MPNLLITLLRPVMKIFRRSNIWKIVSAEIRPTKSNEKNTWIKTEISRHWLRFDFRYVARKYNRSHQSGKGKIINGQLVWNDIHYHETDPNVKKRFVKTLCQAVTISLEGVYFVYDNVCSRYSICFMFFIDHSYTDKKCSSLHFCIVQMSFLEIY